MMRFWESYTSQNHLDVLMNSENYNIFDILKEPMVIREIEALNTRLISVLCEEENLNIMLNYITIHESSQEKSNAINILASDCSKINYILCEDRYLIALFDMLMSNIEDSNIVHVLIRILSTLTIYDIPKIYNFLCNKKDYITFLRSHMNIFEICDYIRIISSFPDLTGKLDPLKRLTDLNIFGSINEYLKSKNNDDVANVSDMIENILLNVYESTNDKRYIALILNELDIANSLCQSLESGSHILLSFCNVCIEFMVPLDQVVPNMDDQLNAYKFVNSFNPAVKYCKILLEKKMEYLAPYPDDYSDPPVGLFYIKIVEFIQVLFQTNICELLQSKDDIRSMSLVLFKMLLYFRWNTIVHQSIFLFLNLVLKIPEYQSMILLNSDILERIEFAHIYNEEIKERIGIFPDNFGFIVKLCKTIYQNKVGLTSDFKQFYQSKIQPEEDEFRLDAKSDDLRSEYDLFNPSPPWYDTEVHLPFYSTLSSSSSSPSSSSSSSSSSNSPDDEGSKSPDVLIEDANQFFESLFKLDSEDKNNYDIDDAFLEEYNAEQIEMHTKECEEYTEKVKPS